MRKILSAILAVAMTFTLIIASAPKLAIASTDLSGTYYIRNMSAGVYLTPDSSINGSVVKTKLLNILGDQVWTLQSGGNGYYYIKSKQTNYYLTVEGSGNTSSVGARLIMTTSKGTDTQLWKFTAYNGGYYIIPKSNTSTMLSTSPNMGATGSPASNGAQVYAYTASPLDGYNQEVWYMYKMQYNLTVDADYDDTYYSRHGSNASSRLTYNLSMLKQRMIETAGIDVTFNTLYTNVDSYVDTAPASCNSHSGLTAMCSCGTCVNSSASILQSYHHTNYHNILYRLTNPNQSRNIKVLYTGHQTCYSNGYSHTSNAGDAGFLSAIWKEKDIVLMMDFKTETDHERMMTVRTVLEMYGLTGHVSSGVANCIFGAYANNASVREMCTLCDDCKSRLIANADEYNHPTN